MRDFNFRNIPARLSRQLKWEGLNQKPEILMRGALMREGKYESGGGNVGTAITFLLIGLGAGAIVGMLFAPKPGRQMRRDLRRGYENARETFDDLRESARDFAEDAVERGSEFAEELRDRVRPLSKAIRRS